MAMNFFEQQHLARRKTRLMVIMFIGAVLGVVAAVDLALAAGWVLVNYHDNMYRPGKLLRAIEYARHVPVALLVWGAVITVAVILFESLRQTASLREGGRAIAAAFGARRVDPDTHDAKERQLLNVVEEMAIASGVRVPAVYILDDESGLNAFAAGHSVSDSVVAVTRGMLETLNRDELQGVIGHEFSHILNGDMALNIRLMGVLAGIVAIGSIGFFLLRASSGSRSSRGDAPLFVGGLALVVIGYSGLFFARLIKAAVSREREFLADASSVQFTRNPEGIASALDKVRTATQGALIQNRYAEEASHMFFGQSFQPWFSGLFDTHPPLEERIERIAPGFSIAQSARQRIAARAAANGRPVQAQAEGGGAGQASGGRALPGQPGPLEGFPGMPPAVLAGAVLAGFADDPGGAARVTDPAIDTKVHSAQMTNLVGAASGVGAVHRLLAALPEPLREGVRRPDGACAIVIALMLAPKDDVRDAQLAAVRQTGGNALADAAAGLEPQTRTLTQVFRLPLIDLALPAIKSAEPEAHHRFLKALEAAIYADRRVSAHEFVVLTLVRLQTRAEHGRPPIKFRTLDAVREEALWVLSLVARAGCLSRDDEGRQREFDAAFAAGLGKLRLENAAPAALADFSMAKAEAMLGRLRLLAPLKKAILVQALFAAILADDKIRVIEAELMRLVCAVIDCPLPPLFEEFDPEKLAG
jgi:Zn-dependent protease with chaperone function